MARNDPERRVEVPAALREKPHISLLGEVNADNTQKLIDGLSSPPDDGDIVIEITTPGGDAELARRMVLEVENAREHLGRRILFLGKTQIYSAGVSLMAAFPREDRFLTPDASLLIHVRQLDKTVEITGPMRASLAKAEAVCAEIKKGMEQEEASFRKLIAGSDVTLDELLEKALYNWYLTAEEACDRGLAAAIVD